MTPKIAELLNKELEYCEKMLTDDTLKFTHTYYNGRRDGIQYALNVLEIFE